MQRLRSPRGQCVFLAALLAMGGLRSAAGQSPSAPLPTVTVSAAMQRDISPGQAFVGTVMPARTSNVGTAVDGRVTELPVEEGDRVAKGQVLAQLLTGLLEIELAGAKAQLAVYEHELEELKNGARPQEIEQAKARMLSYEAMRAYSDARLARVRRLAQQGTMTQDQLQEMAAAADQASQNHIESKYAYELTLQGPRKEQIARGEAQVLVQQEEINRILDQLSKHTIRAPFDGYVVSKSTEVGEWVTKGVPMLKIVELDLVDVIVPVPENYLPFISVGAKVPVEIAALPDPIVTGAVAAIIPEADMRSRSFPVKVRLQNPLDGKLPLIRAGMLARVTLPIGKQGPAVLIHKDAVVLGRANPVVYVFEGDGSQGKVREVAVQLGLADGDFIAVKGPIKPGDQVVVQGNERLANGMAVSKVQ